MSNLRKTKFVPIAKHALDVKSFRQTQQAVNALLNVRMVQGNGIGAIHLSDSNTVVELPSVNETLFPFKVYNINNVSATAVQRAAYATAKVNIDSLTFQIRGGIVSGRNFAIPGVFDPNAYQGNYENAFEVIGTDLPPDGQDTYYSNLDYPPVPNVANGSIEIPNNSDIFISSLATEYAPTQIIIDPNLTSVDGNSIASCWIKMIDPAEGQFITTEIWARMWDANGEFGRNIIPFPIDENVIPIAIFGSFARSQLSNYTFVNQYQFGNLVNRYTPGSSTYRGLWSILNAQIVAGQGLIMYQGDIVVDDTVTFTSSSDSSVTFKKTYVYTAGVGSETVGPSVNPGNWQVIGTTII